MEDIFHRPADTDLRVKGANFPVMHHGISFVVATFDTYNIYYVIM